MRDLLGISLLICCALCAVGCQSAPSPEHADLQLMSLKSKCREDGDKVRSAWKATYYQDTFSDEPEYAYSPSLKTCLWLGEYSGPSVDKDPRTGKLIPVRAHVKFILDVYTNKSLIEYTEHNGQQIGDISEADFMRQKARWFNSR